MKWLLFADLTFISGMSGATKQDIKTFCGTPGLRSEVPNICLVNVNVFLWIVAVIGGCY